MSTTPSHLRRTMHTAVLAALGLSLAACSSGAPSSGGSAGGGKVGISVPVANTPFWQGFSSTIAQQAKDQGVDALTVVNANNQAGKQVSDVQTMLTQGAKGIVLSPVDSGAISATLNTLQSKNIPVVVVNDPPAAGKVAIVVQADNALYGRNECEAMVSAGITSGSVVNIQGDQSNIAGRQRSEGFENCIKEKAPGVKVLRVSTKWDAESATNGLQTLLGSNSDIKGIAMAAGGAFLPSAMSVLQSKNLLVPRSDPKHVFLASIDGVELEYKAMAQGFADCVVAQPVADYAKFGLQYIKQAMEGKTFSEGKTDHGSTIVKDGQGNLLDQLPAKVITPDTLSTVYPAK